MHQELSSERIIIADLRAITDFIRTTMVAAGCADPEGMEGCFSDSFQPWRSGWRKPYVYHN